MLILVLFFSLLCVLYVWYAHASIYWKLGEIGLSAPTDMKSYTLGSSTLSILTYIAIGDSLTAGVGVDSYKDSYPYQVAEQLSESTQVQVKLIPFAIPGIRSDYVLREFMQSVIASEPQVVTLFIGINDMHGGVPYAQFEKQYRDIVSKLTLETTAEVYLITLPYIGTADLISYPFRLSFNAKTKKYNAIIKEIGEEYNLTTIDLYSAHTPYSLNTDYYAEDFFHPNSLGYTKWSETIYAGFNR